ncbi:MAG: hypothetical protein K0S67_1519 [Nitrososphaeraceae archaeon]|jgi:hypothetical protein|nr:hypothetical protein [Nitrososphaeraceae archaeon]
MISVTMPDTKRIIIINLSLSGRIGSIFMPDSFFFYGQQIIIIIIIISNDERFRYDDDRRRYSNESRSSLWRGMSPGYLVKIGNFTNSSNNNMLSDQVLKIDIDSNDIDNDFHGNPIYEMVAKRHNIKRD